MSSLSSMACAAGVTSLMALQSVSAAGQDRIGIPLGETPAIVEIEDLEGQPVDLGQFIGKKPVLAEFWALWCELCEQLMPRMLAAHSKYGDQVEFLAVSVAINQTPRRIKRHLEKHPVPYRVLWDENGRATRAFQAPTTSYIVVLDETGRVTYTGTGADQDIEGAVCRVVEERC